MEKLEEKPGQEECKMMVVPDLNDISIAQILYALSDSNRLKILQMIHQAGGELSCGSFLEQIKVTKPTLSHHFGILRSSGIIATRIEGNQKLNAIRHKELNKRFPGLLDSVLKAIKE